MGNGADLWLSDLQDISNAGQQERESVGCCAGHRTGLWLRHCPEARGMEKTWLVRGKMAVEALQAEWRA